MGNSCEPQFGDPDFFLRLFRGNKPIEMSEVSPASYSAPAQRSTERHSIGERRARPTSNGVYAPPPQRRPSAAYWNSAKQKGAVPGRATSPAAARPPAVRQPTKPPPSRRTTTAAISAKKR